MKLPKKSKLSFRKKNKKNKTLITIICSLSILATLFFLNYSEIEVLAKNLVENEIIPKNKEFFKIPFLNKSEEVSTNTLQNIDYNTASFLYENTVSDVLEETLKEKEIITVRDKNPLLVNKYFKLEKDFIPDNLVDTAYGNLATYETVESFKEMQKDLFDNAGVTISQSDAYKSYKSQEKFYEKMIQTTEEYTLEIIEPGHNEHQTGRAIHLVTENENLNYIYENLYKYGFILRYPFAKEHLTGCEFNEYHITYVGKKIAEKMKEEAVLTLEEYLNNNPDTMLTTSDFIKSKKTKIVLNFTFEQEDLMGDCEVIEKDEPTVEDFKQQNLSSEILPKLQEYLTNLGYDVYFASSSNTDVDNQEIVDYANTIAATYLMTINQKTIKTLDKKPLSFQTWHSNNNNKEKNEILAKSLHKNILENLNITDNGIIALAEDFSSDKLKMPHASVSFETTDLVDTESLDKIVKGIVEGVEKSLKTKVMYLTFDDGPSVHTEKVLKILKERNIVATFFVVGTNVEARPEVIKKILEDGHSIGIHSYSHDYAKIYASLSNFLKDFYIAYDLVVEASGGEYKPILYRFPGGSINSFNKPVYKSIIKEMKKRGFIHYDWNASIEDSVKGSTAKNILVNAKETVKDKDTVVLLMHDTVSFTVEQLEEILDMYYDFRFEKITEDTKPVQFGNK